MKNSVSLILGLTGAALALSGCAERRVVYAPPPTTYVIQPAQQPTVVQTAPQPIYNAPVTSQPVTGQPLPGTPQANPAPAPAPQAQPQVETVPAAPQQQVIVQQAPPPVQVEVVPVSPGVEYVWTPGYWSWNGHGYIWIGGRWYHRPHPHAVWIGGHWERRGHGHVWIGGYWR